MPLKNLRPSGPSTLTPVRACLSQYDTQVSVSSCAEEFFFGRFFGQVVDGVDQGAFAFVRSEKHEDVQVLSVGTGEEVGPAVHGEDEASCAISNVGTGGEDVGFIGSEAAEGFDFRDVRSHNLLRYFPQGDDSQAHHSLIHPHPMER